MPTASQIIQRAADYQNGAMTEWTKELLSHSEFDKDPVYCLATQLIERRPGRFQPADCARSFIISQIPHFMDVLIVRLKDIAERRFAANPNKKQILEIFEKSIKTPAFQEAIQRSKSWATSPNIDHFECELRELMTVYPQAEELQLYRWIQDTRE